MSEYKSALSAATNKKRFWTRKKVVLTSLVSVFALPVAAYAAVMLFGFGDFTAQAAAPGTLTVVQGTSKTTGTLAPGQKVGVRGVVRNTNDYPVKVERIIVRKTGIQVTEGQGAGSCTVTFAGGTDETYPADGASAAVPNGGVAFTVKGGSVTIPAGQDRDVFVDDVIQQADTDKRFCGVSARFAVEGKVGN